MSDDRCPIVSEGHGAQCALHSLHAGDHLFIHFDHQPVTPDTDTLVEAELWDLCDDLADVLSRMVVGWEDRLGVDLAQHPEVVRVMARFRDLQSERKP